MAQPRGTFSFSFPLSRFGFPGDALSALVSLTIQAGDDVSLTEDFARWASGVISCRRREFRVLASSSPSSMYII